MTDKLILRVEGGRRNRGLPSPRTSTTKPLVTVITVVRNGELHLEGSIQSVLSQTYDNIEYIVIDGASTDGTLSIVKRFDDKLDYWLSEPDKGIYDAMNKGIQHARGELIGLLNSDDYYEEYAIQSVVDAYNGAGKKKNVIIFGNFYVIDEGSCIRTEHISTLQYWKGMTINHQTMFVSSDIYYDKFAYNLAYKYAADYDFFIRSSLNKVSFVHTGKFLVNFRNTGATYRNVIPIYLETLLIGRNHLGTFSFRYVLLVLRIIKVLLQVVIKRLIRFVFGPKGFKVAKIIQNWLQGKTWHDMP